MAVILKVLEVVVIYSPEVFDKCRVCGNYFFEPTVGQRCHQNG